MLQANAALSNASAPSSRVSNTLRRSRKYIAAAILAALWVAIDRGLYPEYQAYMLVLTAVPLLLTLRAMWAFRRILLGQRDGDAAAGDGLGPIGLIYQPLFRVVMYFASFAVLWKLSNAVFAWPTQVDVSDKSVGEVVALLVQFAYAQLSYMGVTATSPIPVAEIWNAAPLEAMTFVTFIALGGVLVTVMVLATVKFAATTTFRRTSHDDESAFASAGGTVAAMLSKGNAPYRAASGTISGFGAMPGPRDQSDGLHRFN